MTQPPTGSRYMLFSDLGLSQKVLNAAEAAGYTSPTPIQAEAIPHVLARRDVLGIAQTGTGKTAAFTLPMLTLLESGRARARMPRTLILEPTRELAAQVEENFVKYGSQHKLSVALLIGGVSFGDQDMKIARGADVLIATPGRLLDHIERGKLLLSGVELLVIDEADRMLDMGFIPDIERIVKMVPFTRQTLFFSATMPPEIQRLADAFLHNPVKVEVARAASTAATITQLLVSTGPEPHQKRAILRDLIRGCDDFKNAIIFCNRKRDVATLHRSLVRHGFSAAAIHGDLDQHARTLALDGFRNDEIMLLVASDVAARGLDIPDVSHVFNYDVPIHAEDYVHRIGRTGRAGRLGTAFTLVARGDEKFLAAIEHLTANKVEWQGKALAERTSEDDSASAPDRGEGWRSKDSNDRRGGRNRNKRRGKGRDREERTEQHATSNAPQTQPEDTAFEPRRQEPRQQEPRRNEPRQQEPRQQEPRQYEPRQQESRHRDNRSDQHRRRDRYDNEPDISVVGFGDHVPAFVTRAVTIFSSDNNDPAMGNKPVTPVSMPPRHLEEVVEAAAATEKPAKEHKSRRRGRGGAKDAAAAPVEVEAVTAEPKQDRNRKPASAEVPASALEENTTEAKPARRRTSAKKAEAAVAEAAPAEKTAKPKKAPARAKKDAAADPAASEDAPAKPARKKAPAKKAAPKKAIDKQSPD